MRRLSCRFRTCGRVLWQPTCETQPIFSPEWGEWKWPVTTASESSDTPPPRGGRKSMVAMPAPLAESTFTIVVWGKEDETQQWHDPRVEHSLHLVPENPRKKQYQAWCESRCRRQQTGRWPHDFLLHWIDSALKIPVAYQRVLLHYTAHSLRTHRALVRCLGCTFE